MKPLVIVAALASASSALHPASGWRHVWLNSYTVHIIVPHGASDDARLKYAEQFCKRTGWESDSAVTPVGDGHHWRWRIVCRAR